MTVLSCHQGLPVACTVLYGPLLTYTLVEIRIKHLDVVVGYLGVIKEGPQ